MKKILIMTILTGTFSACTIGMPKITDNTLALKVSDANQYAGTIYLQGHKYYNDFKTSGHVIKGFHPTLSNEENNEVKIKIGVKYEEKINKPIPAKLPNVLKRFDSKYIGDCDPKERCNLTQENLTIVLPTAISLKIDEKKENYLQKLQQDKKALAKAEKTSCGIDTDCEKDRQNSISNKTASIRLTESMIAALDKEEQKTFDFKISYEYAGFNKINTGIHIDSYEASPDSILAYCDRKQCMITDKEGNPVNSITIKRKMTINSNRISHLIAQDKKKAEAAERERKRKEAQAARKREQKCKEFLRTLESLRNRSNLLTNLCRQGNKNACLELGPGGMLNFDENSIYQLQYKVESLDREYNCGYYWEQRGVQIYRR